MKKLWLKYKPEIIKTALGIVVVWSLLVVFPGVMSAIIHAGSSLNIEDPFWFTSIQRIIAFGILAALALPLVLLLLRLFDKWDSNYDVKHVHGNSMATSVYAGLTHAAFIVAVAMVFCKMLGIVFL